MQDGVNFTAQNVKAAAKVCLLGQTVVNNLFPNGDDPLGETIRFKNIPFKIIGVLSKKGENTFGQDQDDVILTPVTTVQKRITATTYYQPLMKTQQKRLLPRSNRFCGHPTNCNAVLMTILRSEHRRN